MPYQHKLSKTPFQRALREAGIQQRELAARIGVTCDWLTRVARGRDRPGTAMVRRIAEALDRSPRWVLKKLRESADGGNGDAR